MTTTYKAEAVKSVHIEGCWPYKYEAPNRRNLSQQTIDRANAREVLNERKREIYHQKKKLLGLRVYKMDIDICNRLNNDTKRN